MLRDDLFENIMELVGKIIDDIRQDKLSDLESKIEKLKETCSQLSVDDVVASTLVLQTIMEQTRCSNEAEAKMHLIHTINYYISSSIEPLYRLALIQHIEGTL